MVQPKDELHEDRDVVQNTEDNQGLQEGYTVQNSEDQDSSVDDGSDRSTNVDHHSARDGAVSRMGCKFMDANYRINGLLTCHSSQKR